MFIEFCLPFNYLSFYGPFGSVIHFVNKYEYFTQTTDYVCRLTLKLFTISPAPTPSRIIRILWITNLQLLCSAPARLTFNGNNFAWERKKWIERNDRLNFGNFKNISSVY